MSRYLPFALGTALTLLLVAPAAARPLDGGMLGGFRLGGSLPESQPPAVDEGLVKNTITFVLGSDGPAPGLPLEAENEYDLPLEPVDDAAMLFAQIEGELVPETAIEVVPEPTSMLLLGSGLMFAARRLRRH